MPWRSALHAPGLLTDLHNADAGLTCFSLRLKVAHTTQGLPHQLPRNHKHRPERCHAHARAIARCMATLSQPPKPDRPRNHRQVSSAAAPAASPSRLSKTVQYHQPMYIRACSAGPTFRQPGTGLLDHPPAADAGPHTLLAGPPNRALTRSVHCVGLAGAYRGSHKRGETTDMIGHAATCTFVQQVRRCRSGRLCCAPAQA